MPSGAELTELLDIKVKRHDGVKDPASGYPILLMKSAASKDADGDYDGDCGCSPGCGCRSDGIAKALTDFILLKAVNAVGGIDEKPDIAGAEHVISELANLIRSEAAELAAGALDEVWDIQMLLEALCLMQCFRDNEIWGDVDDGDMMKSAGGAVFKAHRKFSSDERKKLASEGKALPDGSYPIPDADALHRAAVLARSGHGDVAAAKRLIAKRAKELGVANPLADNDTKKDAPDEGTDLSQVRDADSTVQVQDGSSGVDKDTQTSGEATPDGDGDVANQIEKAVAEATKADRERIEALAAEVAKMRETPIPGGPLLTATAAQRDTRAKSDLLAKASYHDRLAERVGDRELARYHREEARKAREGAAS